MTERRGTGVLDQLERYGRVLDDAAAGPADDTMSREVIDLVPARRRRRAWSVVGVAATLVLVLVAGLIARDDVAPTRRPVGVPTEVEVLRRLSLERLAPFGVVFDGRDVWTAREAIIEESGVSRPIVRMDRRNPSTGAVSQTIGVPQESVFSIASDGAGSIYVAGGGDGGVPDTTVSKVDAASGTVLFTTTLATSCSCQLAASRFGVWLGANGSDAIYRLDSATGEVMATIPLGAKATSMATVANLVEVGMADSTLRLIYDLSVEGTRILAGAGEPADPVDRAVVAVTPVMERGIPARWLTRRDGATFHMDHTMEVVNLRRFAKPVVAVAWLNGALYALHGRSGFDLLVQSTRGPRNAEIHVGRRRSGASSGGPRSVVAAGSTLWVTDGDSARTTLILRPAQTPK